MVQTRRNSVRYANDSAQNGVCWRRLLRRILGLPFVPFVAVLLPASLWAGVKLVMVTLVFFFVFSFLTLSHYVLYQQSTTPIFYCCSPFSSHIFQIYLNAVLPWHSRSSSRPLSLHLLDISSLCQFVISNSVHFNLLLKNGFLKLSVAPTSTHSLFSNKLQIDIEQRNNY